jgi:hypothetical protein
MLFAKISRTQALKATGAAFLVSTLVACGGGGGSDTTAATPPAGTTPAAPTPAAPAPLGGINCIASVAGSGVGPGYVVGACVLPATATTAAQINSQFQNFQVNVATDASDTRKFSLDVQTPVSAGSRTLDGTNERCDGNILGNVTNYLTELYVDATNPATSPSFSILSPAQKYGRNVAQCRLAANPLDGASYPLTYLDFGTFERYLGESSLYYGGWTAQRTATNAAPTSAKTYAAGLMIGYRTTNSLSYGMSATVPAGASWNGSTLTFTMGSFVYSRRNETNPNPGEVIPTLTFASTAGSGGTLSGVITGTGVTGVFEGKFGGPNGQEFAGKMQLTLAQSQHKIVGAFAIK